MEDTTNTLPELDSSQQQTMAGMVLKQVDMVSNRLLRPLFTAPVIAEATWDVLHDYSELISDNGHFPRWDSTPTVERAFMVDFVEKLCATDEVMRDAKKGHESFFYAYAIFHAGNNWRKGPFSFFARSDPWLQENYAEQDTWQKCYSVLAVSTIRSLYLYKAGVTQKIAIGIPHLRLDTEGEPEVGEEA